MKTNFKKKLKDFFKHLYLEDIYIIAKQGKRGRVSSYILLAIKYLFIILLGNLAKYSQTLIKLDFNLSFLDQQQLYLFLSDAQYINQIVQVIFSVHLAIFSLILIIIINLLLHCLFKGNTSTFLIYKITYQSDNQNHIFGQIKKIVSHLIQSYGYLFLIPSVYFSFQDLSSVVSIVNILLTLFIGFLYYDTDYNYSLNSQDFLQVPYSSLNHFVFLGELLFCAVVSRSDSYKEVITILFLLLDLFRLLFRPYYIQEAQQVALFFNFYGIALSFLILISRTFPKPSNLISFFSLILIPIVFIVVNKTVIQIEKGYLEDLQKSLNNQQIDIPKLDRIIRLPILKKANDVTLTFLQIEKILIKQMNIVTSNYLEDNLNKQKISLNDNDDTHIYQNAKKIRKQIKCIMKEIFQNSIKRKSGTINTRDYVIYFVFLIQYMGSLRQYQILYKSILLKESSFSKHVQIFNSVHNTIFKEQQEILKKDQIGDPFGLNYLKVIQYEKQLEETIKLFDRVIRSKIEVLLKMKQKLINLEDLIKEIEYFLKNNQQLKQNLNQLTKINSSNNILYELLHLYLDTLTFTVNDISISRYGTDLTSKKLDLQRNKQNNQQQDLFSKFTCIVASTYEESGVLTVKHVTSNFYKIFNFSSKEEVINKRADIIIPSYLQSIHQQYVNNFLESKCKNKQEIKSQQVVFGALSNFHIIPLQIDIKISPLLDQSQFGLTAKITSVDHKKHLIIYCSKTYQILGMTQQIPNLIGLSTEKIVKFKINQLFPNIQENLKQPEVQVREEKIQTQISSQDIPVISQQEDFLYLKRNLANDQSIKEFQCQRNNLLVTLDKVKKDTQDVVNDYQYLMMNLVVKKIDYKLNQTFSLLQIVDVKQYSVEQNLPTLLHHLQNQIRFYQTYDLRNENLKPLVPKENLQTLFAELSNLVEFTQNNQQSLPSNESLCQQNNQEIVNNSFQAQNLINQTYHLELISSQQLFQHMDPGIAVKKQNQRHQITEDTKCISGHFQNNHPNQQNENCNQNQSKISEAQMKHFSPTTRRNLLDKQDESTIQLIALDQDTLNTNVQSPRDIRDRHYSQLEKTSVGTQINYTNNSISKLNLKSSDFNYLNVNDLYSEYNSKNLLFTSKFQHQKEAQNQTCQSQSQAINQFSNFQQDFFSSHQNEADKNNMIETLLSQTDKKQFILSKNYAIKSSKINLNESKKREKEVLKQIIDKQEDIQSSSSKKSSYSVTSRQLKQILSDTHFPSAIKVSTMIGITSYLIINILIIIQYFTLSNQIQQNKQDKYYSTWPIDFQAAVWGLVRDNNIIYALKELNDYKFPSASAKSLFMNNTVYNIFEGKNVVSRLIAETSGENANVLPFQLLKNLPNTFQIGKYYNNYNISKVSSIVQKFIFYYVNYTSTIHFSIILSYQHTFRYSVGLGTGRPEYYMILNNLNFYNSLGQLQKQLIKTQKERDSQLQSDLVQTMVLIIIISGVCIAIILPLYSYIQKQREDIVNLFSTFSSMKIDEMLEKIQTSYEPHRKLNNLSALKSNNTKSEGNKKMAKNISTTTKLHKISSSLVLKLVILFGLTIIYPIVNKIITSNYLTQQTITLQTVSKFF